MYTLRKNFYFTAGHQLLQSPEGQPCREIHGHNYRITVEFRSETLNSWSLIIDYRKMEIINDYLQKTFDHQMLNSNMIEEPTSENLSKHLYDFFKPVFIALYAVEVSETPDIVVRYECKNGLTEKS